MKTVCLVNENMTKGHISLFRFYKVSRISKSTETEIRLVVARVEVRLGMGEEGEDGEGLFNEYSFFGGE